MLNLNFFRYCLEITITLSIETKARAIMGILAIGRRRVMVREIKWNSWIGRFILTVPFFAQEYKLVVANCQGSLIKCWR